MSGDAQGATGDALTLMKLEAKRAGLIEEIELIDSCIEIVEIVLAEYPKRSGR